MSSFKRDGTFPVCGFVCLMVYCAHVIPGRERTFSTSDWWLLPSERSSLSEPDRIEQIVMVRALTFLCWFLSEVLTVQFYNAVYTHVRYSTPKRKINLQSCSV